MRTWTWQVTVVLGVVLAHGGRAAAQECASDADCAQGFACEVTAESGCGYACPAGQDPCTPPPDSMCQTMQYKSCVPAPCMSDADCAEGMACFTQTSEVCTDSAAPDCAPGADCPAINPAPSCTTTTDSRCVPKYLLPCATAADCGDGFECVQDVSMSCSGGGARPAPAPEDGGAAIIAPVDAGVPADSCTTTTLETFSCRPIEQVCDTDADCLSGWTCLSNPEQSVCMTTATDPGAAPSVPVACGGAVPELCRVCADGSCGKPVCDPSGAWTFVCAEDTVVDAGAGAAGSGGGTVDPCGTVSTDLPPRLCAPPYYDLGYAQGGVSKGEVGSVSGPAVPGSDTQTSSDTGTNALAPGEAGHAAASDPGCAVRAPGHAHAPGVAGWLGLLGLGALAVRRRRARDGAARHAR